MISVRTTEFSGADDAGKMFQPNMFSRTDAFALSVENGRIRVDMAELRAGGVKVSRVRSTGHMVDLTEDAAVTVLFPSAGQLRVRVAAADYRITAKAVCVFGPNARRTRAEAPQHARMFHANALMLPHRGLLELVQSSRDDGAPWPGLPDGTPISANLPEARRLSELLDYIARHFDDAVPPLSDRAGVALAVLGEELLTDLVLRSGPAVGEDAVAPASWLRVRMAEAIMRARRDEPLSMAEVAREVGVGLRTLQLAFIETRAMGPRDVLLRMRLERARECLLAAQPMDTVTSIALDCGFAHLGRFPGAYRTAFGELPVETLARARRRLA